MLATDEQPARGPSPEGYLLPWDNRAYWGTVVATQIGAQMPVVGPHVARLLGGEGPIGVVTFARFFGLHVYLVGKHRVAPMPGDEARPTKPFYPVQVFKDTVAIFIAFAILFTTSPTRNNSRRAP